MVGASRGAIARTGLEWGSNGGRAGPSGGWRSPFRHRAGVDPGSRLPRYFFPSTPRNEAMLHTLGKAVVAGALALLAAPAVSAAPMVKQLADDVYMMSESYYAHLVVVGEDGVLITDPGFTPLALSLKNAIAGITDKPVTRIVLSHEHYDHVGGTEVFPEAPGHLPRRLPGGVRPRRDRAGPREGPRDVHRLPAGGLPRAAGGPPLLRPRRTASPPPWCICPSSGWPSPPTSTSTAR